MNNNSQLYVYNDIEVILTGRKASRSSESKLTKPRRAPNKKVDDIKLEITPSNSNEGSWKKWVQMSDLYTINNTEDK